MLFGYGAVDSAGRDSAGMDSKAGPVSSGLADDRTTACTRRASRRGPATGAGASWVTSSKGFVPAGARAGGRGALGPWPTLGAAGRTRAVASASALQRLAEAA